MTGRTIAIGDIHGCADALDAILTAIDPRPEDTIVPLGDYVDRGPDSKRVVQRLIELSAQCRLEPLMGNHELMLLASLDDAAALSFWLQCGGMQTLDSYGGKLDDIPPDHLQFLRQCRKSYETPTHIFLHANYDPQLPIEDQDEEALFWRHLTGSRPAPHQSGKTVVVGHTPQVDGRILDLGHLICLDTFCCGSGYLSAMDMRSGQVWQADQSGR